MSKLTVKKELFAHKVVELDNQSEAYRIAYPHSQKWKDSAVWSCASTLASDPKVKQRIKELRMELNNKEIITKEEMLQTYAEMYRTNPMDYLTVIEEEDIETDKEGNVVDRSVTQKVIIKNLDELTEAQQKCIKSIKPTRNGIELELYPKTDVGDRIAKMLGLNDPEKLDIKSELTGDKHTDVIDILQAAEKLKKE